MRLPLEYLHLVAQVGEDQDNLIEQLVVGLDEAVQRDGLAPRNSLKPDRAGHLVVAACQHGASPAQKCEIGCFLRHRVVFVMGFVS